MVRKIFQTVADAMSWFAMASITALVALNGYEIFSRFIFQRSNYWIQDVTTLLMVWFVFPGMVKVIWEKRDILIDLLYGLVPAGVQKVLQTAVYLVVIIFTAAMSWATYRYLLLIRSSVSITAHIPMYLFTGVILLGFILFTAMYIYDLVMLFTGRESAGELGGRAV
jgi:TRAP-type C4-dicarboxylate transport system permease small subunit